MFSFLKIIKMIFIIRWYNNGKSGISPSESALLAIPFKLWSFKSMTNIWHTLVLKNLFPTILNLSFSLPLASVVRRWIRGRAWRRGWPLTPLRRRLFLWGWMFTAFWWPRLSFLRALPLIFGGFFVGIMLLALLNLVIIISHFSFLFLLICLFFFRPIKKFKALVLNAVNPNVKYIWFCVWRGGLLSFSACRWRRCSSRLRISSSLFLRSFSISCNICQNFRHLLLFTLTIILPQIFYRKSFCSAQCANVEASRCGT